MKGQPIKRCGLLGVEGTDEAEQRGEGEEFHKADARP